MTEQKWGDFTVRRHGATWAPEMMLHTHGGYSLDDGMADIETNDIVFYAAHPITITFDFAHPIMRGEKGADAIKSIIPAQSSVWNYKLQILTDEQRNESLCHWQLGNLKGTTNWDWWEVSLKDRLTDMKALARKLNDFAYLENHTYRRMHFLCCREWMGKGAAPAFGAIEAPKSKH